MFGVPVVKHGVNGHLRQKGKIAELALGYRGKGGDDY
jgi:DNA polymerase